MSSYFWSWTRKRDPMQAAVAAAALACFALSVWAKLTVGARAPFWLDEAWTGAIVGQRTWGDFWRQVYWDVNAPLYYLLMHLWQAPFGLSDAALRWPSLLLSLATPLIPVFWKADGLTRGDRLTWGALIALWFPGVVFAQEARGYALLLIASTAQTIAYIRLLAKPDTARATVWTALSALAILTHYDALPGVAIQGLIYLAVHRMRALRTWPASLAFVPAFAWIGVHLPRIAEFLRPDVAWYGVLQSGDVPAVSGYLVGSWEILQALGAVLAAAALLFAFSFRDKPSEGRGRVWLWAAPLAAGLGAGELIVAGFLRPSFTTRYLTPFAPGVLLGFALAVRLLAGRYAALGRIALMAAMLYFGHRMITRTAWVSPKAYNYETASAALAKARPSQLVFLWDHPAGRVERPQQLDAAGGFFLRRAGLPITVIPLWVPADQDANPRLIAAARPPGSAILWVYDVRVRGTSAIAHPPRIAQIDPSWTCGDFGRGRFGIVACQRAAAGALPGASH